MDQRDQELLELNNLWDHLSKVKSLEKKIEKNNQRIRKGVSDKYVFYDKKPANEEKNRKAKCRSENLAKVPVKERAWKISRVVLIVVFIVVLLTCIFLFSSENKVPDWIGILAPVGVFTCIGYWIATVIIISNMDDTGYNFSAKQKKWIAEGARIDQATTERNQAAFVAARDKSYKEQREMLDKLQKDQLKYEKELAQHRQAIAASNVVGSNDKNSATIYFLIDQLENKRAHSVQDAFLQREARIKKEEEERNARIKKEEEERARLARYQFMYDMQQQANGQRALREAEDYMRQTFHNMELQKQARRQTEELERIRRELEKS